MPAFWFSLVYSHVQTPSRPIAQIKFLVSCSCNHLLEKGGQRPVVLARGIEAMDCSFVEPFHRDLGFFDVPRCPQGSVGLVEVTFVVFALVGQGFEE